MGTRHWPDDADEYCEKLEQELSACKEACKMLYADKQQLKQRVKKLEETNLELAVNVEACCELTEMDMGSAIERLFEIDNTESKELLNKFAIEQQIKGAKLAADTLILPSEQQERGWFESNFLEQLRKEQSK